MKNQSQVVDIIFNEALVINNQVVLVKIGPNLLVQFSATDSLIVESN